jgi:tubulin polyglutamylase TTLL4
MHTDGLARFASVKYSERNDTLNDRYMHLTNYSINKLSTSYDQNDDANACKGMKWTIKSLWSYLKQKGINTERLWGALRNLVLRTILAGEGPINSMMKTNLQNKYNSFELFGIDVLLDSELVPWLLEVNISPSLHSASGLDMAVKGPLVTALLNTVLYQVKSRGNHRGKKLIHFLDCRSRQRYLFRSKLTWLASLTSRHRSAMTNEFM